jgi:DNA-binding NarL/FixJ family response regulator
MQTLQILIVDEHRGMRAMIRELLGEDDAMPPGRLAAFAECASATEALRFAAAWPCELMIVDLHVPDMEGVDCIRRLRELAPGAVLIVVTALQGEIVARSARLAGADGVVFKDDLTTIQTMATARLLRRSGT